MGDFTRVCDVAEVPDPGKTLVEVGGEMVALFHVDGAWHAIDDVCTHDGGPLADGELRNHTIACPRHGAKFDIRTGAALTMPAVRPTRAHEVKVEDGGVWVRLRATAGAVGPAAHALPVTPAPAASTRAAACAASPRAFHGAKRACARRSGTGESAMTPKYRRPRRACAP